MDLVRRYRHRRLVSVQRHPPAKATSEATGLLVFDFIWPWLPSDGARCEGFM
jgi:hypothetical protein